VARNSRFELSPPGSFPLCVDSALDAQATADLEYVSNKVRGATDRLPVLGLILTGSVARGEGALITESNGNVRWLSDLEFQLILHGRRRGSSREVGKLLQGLEHDINGEFAGRGLRVGFNWIAAPHLQRLRPAIFSREMLEHGKLLWGQPSLITLPQWWYNGTADIPLLDAFRLLNNRTVQLVDARLTYKTPQPGGELLPAYTLHKFWIELATSLSVFLGCYRTSYRERRTALAAVLGKRAELFGEARQLLLARLDHAIAVKLGRISPTACTDESFREAAAVAATVWNWETEQMLGGKPPSADWDGVLERFRRLEPRDQRLRDWARLPRGRSLRQFVNDAQTALRAGSFANAVYAAGCLLMFFWDDVSNDDHRGAQIRSTISRLVGLKTVPGAEGRAALARAMVTGWERHLHFAPR
jgi:hypothetical protein